MNKIASALFAALETSNDDALVKLAAEMRAYADRYPRSMKSLLKIPGFSKLWEVMEDVAYFAASLEDVCERCGIAVRSSGDHRCEDCGRDI